MNCLIDESYVVPLRAGRIYYFLNYNFSVLSVALW